MSTFRTFIITFIIFAITCASSYASNYAGTFGASPKGLALGNAMTARANDWSSVYYNIAGLGKTVDDYDRVTDDTKIYKNQFAAGYLYNKPEFDVDIDRNTQALYNLETDTFVLGGVLDTNLFYKLPSYISSSRIGVIVGLNADLTMVKINDIDMRSHNYFRYGRESQSIMIMFGLGFGLFDDMIGFGAGVSQSMGGSGQIMATNLKITTQEQTPDLQAKFDFEISKNPLILGAYIKPGRVVPELEGLDLAFSYKQESYLYVEKFNMITTVDAGEIIMPIVAGMFDFYQPPIYTTGLAYSTSKYILSVDLELRQWSKYKVSKYTRDFFEEDLNVDLPELDDVIIPRVGLQCNLTDSMDLLMGYYYEKSCIPDKAAQGVFNLLDNDKHVGSAGVVCRLPKTSNLPLIGGVYEGIMSGLNGPVDVTASYQLQYHVDRDVNKTNPTDVNPDYSYGGTCHSFMVGMTYHL